MIAVFLAFVASPVPSLKMLGLGLATAVLVDATLVRMVLVPATMALLGKANWWLPGWLDRVLPHLSWRVRPTTRLTRPGVRYATTGRGARRPLKENGSAGRRHGADGQWSFASSYAAARRDMSWCH